MSNVENDRPQPSQNPNEPSEESAPKPEILPKAEADAAKLNERARSDMTLEQLIAKARLFVRRSNESAAALLEWYWMLGEALELIRPQTPDGEWRRTLKSLGLNHESAGQARAIHRDIPFEDLHKFRNKTQALRRIGRLAALDGPKDEAPATTDQGSHPEPSDSAATIPQEVSTPAETTPRVNSAATTPPSTTAPTPPHEASTGQVERPQGESQAPPASLPRTVTPQVEPEPAHPVRESSQDVAPTWHVPRTPFEPDKPDSPNAIEWLRQAALYLDWLVEASGLTPAPADFPDAFRSFRAVIRAFHAPSSTLERH